MEGSLLGFCGGAGLFLLFQLVGVAVSDCLLPEETRAHRLLLGSVGGSVLLQWLPALCAFVFGFTKTAHLVAAGVAVVGVGAVCICTKPPVRRIKAEDLALWLRERKILLLPVVLWLFFAFLVEKSFVLQKDGIYTGQSTYGDMCMHLGFITSMAKQGAFPPEYSILPGTPLCYPFLCDSISAGVYLFGASLDVAYTLPMLFAGAQVIFGYWMLAGEVLQTRKRQVLAFMLFFFSGGLGFFYFLFNSKDGAYTLKNLLEGFYVTPTNLVDENIRWVNVVVDMLVPQRATLFGWAVLFPTLYLLIRAVFKEKTKLFVPAAFLAATLPMVHTHSFVALAVLCGGWLLYTAVQTAFGKEGLQRAAGVGKWVLGGLLLALWGVSPLLLRSEYRNSPILLWATVALAGAFVVLLGIVLVLALQKSRKPFGPWLLFLGIVLAGSVWQLFFWTFRQSSGEGFVRAHFNWANIDDGYLWFYIKNLGLGGALCIFGLFRAKGKRFFLYLPTALLWFAAELVVFQPNEYDNNKLLYVCYALLCMAGAQTAAELSQKLVGAGLKRAVAVGAVMLCTVSAVLTMAREARAEYQLWGRGTYALCRFVEENTEPDAVFLTNHRHNNEIAALTGRNIVCGSSSYLYFHGLDYQKQQSALYSMFENPRENGDLFAKYHVDYILLSSHERTTFAVDEAALDALFPVIYRGEDAKIYQVTE